MEPEPPEVAAVAGAIPVVGGVGKRVIEARGPAALDRFPGAGALDGGGVDQQQIVEEPWAMACELGDQRLDLAADPQPALVERLTRGKVRKQVREAVPGDSQEPLVGRDPHDRLREAQGDDLRISDPAARVRRPLRQEIVRHAVNNCEQQVEVGVHRGPPEGRRWVLSTADFDLRCYVPFKATTPPSAVALLI